MSDFQIDPHLELGPVVLRVNNLATVGRFYQDVLGLTALHSESNRLILGVGEKPLVVLVESPEAPKAPANATGLYHLAIVLPTRADLARWFQHAFPFGIRIGQSNHGTHEAFYLRDPEENGIEVYRDAPANEWPWEGNQLGLARQDINLRTLMAELRDDADRWAGAPLGTRMGHVHLRMADPVATRAFYGDLLGFNITIDRSKVVFAAAGGYHHTLGNNAWYSEGGSPPPAGSRGLQYYTLEVSPASAQALLERIKAAGKQVEPLNDSFLVRDPSQNAVLIQTHPTTVDSVLKTLE